SASHPGRTDVARGIQPSDAGLDSTYPPLRGSARLAASVSRLHATITIAGAVVMPVARMSDVATSGAVPLKVVKATLNTRATPLKRTGVGNRSVRITANVPLTSAAHSPARTRSTVGFTVRAANRA